MAPPSVFFYISGHGFGHASRQIEIVNALGARAGGALRIVVRTSAAPWLFHRTVRVPFSLIEGDVDTGVVQIDSLHLDERATIEAAARFYASLDQRAREEADLLRSRGARLVVADAPPLGCAAAEQARLPAAVCSNFTWDWIYREYDAAVGAAPGLVPLIEDTYRSAVAGWRLPMHGGFATISTCVDVPFVARHACHGRAEVRGRLGLPDHAPLVLASFGGYGVADFDPGRLDCLDEYGVIVTGREGCPEPLPRGVHFVEERILYDRGLRYEDLVGAVDVVVTKPGYGIISECVANRTAILYTSRGRFAEYDVLVAEMPRYVRCRFIDHESLFGGGWRAPLDELMSAPPPPERPRTDGADVVAGLILQTLDVED